MPLQATGFRVAGYTPASHYSALFCGWSRMLAD